ncbi:MAG: membrane dipeptidase [Lasallia pustulata]|uniref:Dipeptidase n=1 Tax=Lasallia pustulata TaxID=136370 RepID=A0A5M8Q1P2_9LECA|nr:MAG: membrane dipeptidase [Lasallia pustulata]
MPSEVDPLLPKVEPAPEISGHGYSQTARGQFEPAEDAEDEGTPPKAGASALKSIVGLFTVVVGFALVIALLVPGGLGSVWKAPKNDRLTVRARVDKIMTETPLIDGHNDLAILIRYLYGNQIYDMNFTESFENGGLPFHVDLPRLKKGKVGGAFWSAFVGCPHNSSDFSDANYVEAVASTLSQLDLLRRLADSYPKTFSSPNINGSTALTTFADRHQLISPLALEGLHQIGNSYANLRLFHSLGARYATLTHNCHNAFADAALITNSARSTIKAPPYWEGVSQRGREIVKEMNRIGMLVDLAHVSKDTMLDVLGGRPKKWAGSAAPVMFSHSSAYGLCPHPRNVPDDVLRLVKKTNSIVMVNFSPDFISCLPSNSSTGIPDVYPPNATIHQVARHIVYIGSLIGYDHVGVGSDFDGIFSTPDGLEDVSKFPDLVAELLEMGVTDADAGKVVGANVLRVWADADKVALKMQKDGVLPAEDRMKPLV